jgi:hypothetical protein
MCQLVAQMEAKAIQEQNQATAPGFPFHNFSSSFGYQVPCYSCHGNVSPAPAIHLLKCCPLHAQQLIHRATCLQNQRQRLIMERNGEVVQMTNLTATLPALLMSSSAGDWYIYIFGLWLLLIV